ncbi:putative autophagy protein [Botrytis fragariae]|uniref:Putative autophagy protein n=1 Tax=Botrytis fragariae TaxID=1964551 RepID=A0A8H6B1J8_9HELO|nr:putative autophagy protein [Botrytis fragariae]KAF5877392.1 putative autophagy protein [Botrytis fragariae]
MASWRDDYMKALQDRDEREQTSYQRFDPSFIDAYTQLLDKVSAQTAAAAIQDTPSTSANPSSLSSSATSQKAISKKANQTQSSTSSEVLQLRASLSEALRSSSHFQSRLKTTETSLQALRTKSASVSKQLETLTRERNILARKIRDRDEELRAKTKGFHDVQDEMISLNLQLNIAEQNEKRAKAENKELIDRWMAQKGREADEMNKKFGT